MNDLLKVAGLAAVAMVAESKTGLAKKTLSKLGGKKKATNRRKKTTKRTNKRK